MRINRRTFYVFREQAADGGDSGGGGAATNTDNSTVADGAAAGTGGNNDDGSLLATGAKAGDTSTTDFIPEKLRVLKEDGTLDLEASSRKLAEVYASAEKRIGSGNLPPKTAEEYAVTVPEEFKEAFNPAEDEGFKAFRDGAHKLSFTQEQLDFVMSNYFTIAPQLVTGAVIIDQQAGEAELRKTWATDASFSLGLKNSAAATMAIAAKAGIDFDAVMASPLRNDPMFHRLMAAIGPELKEDSNPGGEILGGDEEVNELMASEAYTNPRHKDHAKVSAKVKTFFDKKFGTEAAA